MDILDDKGVSKLSAKVFLNVNYSFKLYSFAVTLLPKMIERSNSHSFNQSISLLLY